MTPIPLNASPNKLDCADYYYGIGVMQDFKKAFECFENSEDPIGANKTFLMIMYLNGEGVSQSVPKAKEILEKVAKINGNINGYELIQKIINDRLLNSSLNKRVEYCDVAEGTLAINDCMIYQRKLSEQKEKIFVEKVAAQLNPDQKQQFAAIGKFFGILQHEDFMRVDVTSNGSMRTMDGLGQEDYLETRHHKRIEDWVLKKFLQPATKNEYLDSGQQLNKVYSEKIENVKKYYEDWVNAYKDNPDYLKGGKEEYHETVGHFKKSQRNWIKYRDSWVDLIKTFKLDNLMKDVDIETSVKTRLTKERIEEFNYDPGAPDNP